jgi:hypothetical protein
VPLWDNDRLRLDPAPDFSECGSGSNQKVPDLDLPPWPSGVIDTAGHKKFNFIVEYLCEYVAIRKKALTRGSRAQMELFDEKNRRSKIS